MISFAPTEIRADHGPKTARDMLVWPESHLVRCNPSVHADGDHFLRSCTLFPPFDIPLVIDSSIVPLGQVPATAHEPESTPSFPAMQQKPLCSMYRPSLILVFSAFLALTSALNITYPTAGSTIRTTRNLTITWTSTPSDPSQINLVLTNTNSTGLDTHTLGSNVTTSDGQYIASANTLSTLSGNDFKIMINSIASEGNAFVAQSGDFALEDSRSSSSSATSASATATATGSGATGMNMIENGRVGLFAAVAAFVLAVLV